MDILDLNKNMGCPLPTKISEGKMLFEKGAWCTQYDMVSWLEFYHLCDPFLRSSRCMLWLVMVLNHSSNFRDLS